MYYVLRIQNCIKRISGRIADERGDGPINYIALVVGLALVAAAVMGALEAVAPSVRERIIDVIKQAIGVG